MHSYQKKKMLWKYPFLLLEEWPFLNQRMWWALWNPKLKPLGPQKWSQKWTFPEHSLLFFVQSGRSVSLGTENGPPASPLLLTPLVGTDDWENSTWGESMLCYVSDKAKDNRQRPHLKQVLHLRSQLLSGQHEISPVPSSFSLSSL